MKHLTEKFWFLTAIISLLAMMSTFVVVEGNREVSEESELVDIFEEVEAIAHRSERRERKGPRTAAFLRTSTYSINKLRPCCRFFKPPKERDDLNGIGGYLLT